MIKNDNFVQKYYIVEFDTGLIKIKKTRDKNDNGSLYRGADFHIHFLRVSYRGLSAVFLMTAWRTSVAKNHITLITFHGNFPDMHRENG